jgi:hypothetical protein
VGSRRESSLRPHGAWSDIELDYHFLARGYYQNDQRIEWSGVESFFGVEGILDGTIRLPRGEWDPQCYGEFYLNQPFNENIYIDIHEGEGEERPSYLANYRVDTLEISQLYLSFDVADCEIKLGKFRTPFGRYAFPLMTNARLFAPFIRTEAILWRETGLSFKYHPEYWVTEVSLVNGCEDRDTNSTKGLVARVGMELESFACGGSIKLQDGIGSEEQKMYNEHVGMDVLLRRGGWTFSSEIIYDQYGFRRPKFDPNDIFWERGIYYRELNKGFKKPISGVGYYFDTTYRRRPWLINLNYGEYYPEQLGVEAHDVVNRRGIVKIGWDCQEYIQLYSAVIVETAGYEAQCERDRRGWCCLGGIKMSL